MKWKIEDCNDQQKAQIQAKLNPPVLPDAVFPVIIQLCGQIHGGKNSMLTTRSGRHYPNELFAHWRDDAIRQVKAQHRVKTIAIPLKATINYYSVDRRRRDVPAILDALWHVLERSGLVADDALIQDVTITSDYDKENPRVQIILNEKKQLTNPT